MPIDTNFFARRFHNFQDGELDEIERALGSGVAHCVAQNDGARSTSNRGRVQTLHGVRVCSSGIFRHIHRRKVMLDSELYGLFRGAFEMIDRPILDQSANWAGTEKGGSFNGEP